MPRVRLHALIADRTGHGHFAEYHTRFGHSEKVVRNAACPCGKPLAPRPYNYAFLKGLVQPPLYGHIKSWLRQISQYYTKRAELRQQAKTLVEQGYT